jgi:hypothetical protein
MAAGLHALCYDHVGAGVLRGAGFGHRGNIGKPLDPFCLHPVDKRFGIKPHHRRDDRRRGFQHGLALRFEIRRRRIAGLRMNLRSPPAQECTHGVFRFGMAMRRGIRNPQIEREGAVAFGADFGGPCFDDGWLHQQRAAGAEPTGIGDRDGQRRRAGACHRSEQDRHAQTIGIGKCLRTGQGRMGGRHDEHLIGCMAVTTPAGLRSLVLAITIWDRAKMRDVLIARTAETTSAPAAISEATRKSPRCSDRNPASAGPAI